MSRRRITTAEDSAALLLPQEMLDEMGISIGDEVDVSVVNRTLILRSLDEAERARKIDAATDAVFERRRSAYEELAEGAK
ncbi:MAG: AbrB/MazE/SpoVT family DNA-binding domain-containing protein [Pyrinomonadaceae bacterium]|nr:AbrB/MazE/SpoVT family DNA-binding domain-containing protein [Pyrinomonadaceae bacterium]